MVRVALRREIFRLRVSSKRFPSVPIPTCSPARDDGVGEQHPVISEGDEPHSRHFDRSEAEWRNLPPLMVRAALRREIFRLRVSSKRFPSAPYRHAAPLEMTVLASSIQSFQKGTNPIPVISTGVEKSHSTNDKMPLRPPSFRPMKTYKKAVKKWFPFFTAFLRGLPMTSSGFYSFSSVHCRQSSSIGSRNSLLLMKDSLQA